MKHTFRYSFLWLETTQGKGSMSSPTPTTGNSPSGTASSTPTCTTAVPGKYGEVPPDACNSQWAFHPDFAANLAWAVLMGVTTCVHLIQAVCYKKVTHNDILSPRLEDA